jgi:hypothetical protein
VKRHVARRLDRIEKLVSKRALTTPGNLGDLNDRYGKLIARRHSREDPLTAEECAELDRITRGSGRMLGLTLRQYDGKLTEEECQELADLKAKYPPDPLTEPMLEMLKRTSRRASNK